MLKMKEIIFIQQRLTETKCKKMTGKEEKIELPQVARYPDPLKFDCRLTAHGSFFLFLFSFIYLSFLIYLRLFMSSRTESL